MMKQAFWLMVALLCGLALPQAVFPLEAKAEIKGTSPDSTVTGLAKITEVEGGLKIEVELSGVTPPGKHGFHIHENGSCEDKGNAAGGHYNPDGVMHGSLLNDGFTKAHAGDFGNIDINDDGTGTLSVIVPGLSLSGEKYNVTGRAMILHEKEDDFGQPTGNAGGRIGCGIIEVIQVASQQE
jgi:Cu-Zn family superoxide dismutase